MTQHTKVKVLGFDSWTAGARHYSRLVDSFQEQDIELMLIHLGSWGNDPLRDKEEWIDGLKVRDISYYSNQNFDYILSLESPDVVLFLSTQSFAHRAFQRYCHKRCIPTINLDHGIVTVNQFGGQDAKISIKLVPHLRWVYSRLYTTCVFVLPRYLTSLWQTKATFQDWLQLLRDLWSKALGKRSYRYAIDARPTKSCVFVEADVEDAMVRYSQARANIVVVGNPDLIYFGFQPDTIGSYLNRNHERLVDVMYIGSGMIGFGLYFKSHNQYSDYLGQIALKLKNQGFNLLYKIKPQSSKYEVQLRSNLEKYKIEIIDSNNFMTRLNECCACITEPTSLGILPSLLGMPVFINQIGQLNELQYGDIFTGYPRSMNLRNSDFFAEMLEDEKSRFDPLSTHKWIEANSGPLPASQMPKRVGEVVLSLAEDYRTCAV